MKKQMEINSDELAELIEDEPDVHVELLTDDPDGLMIEWWAHDDRYHRLWAFWDNEQTYIVDDYSSDDFLYKLDIGTGDRLTVNKILDIVL